MIDNQYCWILLAFCSAKDRYTSSGNAWGGGLSRCHPVMFGVPESSQHLQALSLHQVLSVLAPGRCGSYFKCIISTLIIQNSSWGNHCEIAFRWIPLNLTNEKSKILVQVMARCHQAASHYLNQCWPSFMVPYGVTRGHSVNHGLSCCFPVSWAQSYKTHWRWLRNRWMWRSQKPVESLTKNITRKYRGLIGCWGKHRLDHFDQYFGWYSISASYRI